MWEIYQEKINLLLLTIKVLTINQSCIVEGIGRNSWMITQMEKKERIFLNIKNAAQYQVRFQTLIGWFEGESLFLHLLFLPVNYRRKKKRRKKCEKNHILTKILVTYTPPPPIHISKAMTAFLKKIKEIKIMNWNIVSYGSCFPLWIWNKWVEVIQLQ